MMGLALRILHFQIVRSLEVDCDKNEAPVVKDFYQHRLNSYEKKIFTHTHTQ